MILNLTNCKHNTDKNAFDEVLVTIHSIIFLSRQQFKQFTQTLIRVKIISVLYGS